MGLTDEPALDAALISRISHDLKSPLASAREALHLMAGGRLGEIDDRQQKILKLALRNLEIVDGRWSQLVAWYRLELGIRKIEVQPHNLSNLLEAMVKQRRSAFEARGLSWHDDLSQTSIAVQCDPTAVEDICSALLDNALQFTPSGGKVQVTLEAEPAAGQSRLTIANSILHKPDEPALEMRPFSALHRETPIPGQGLGLGLATSRMLADQQGGSLNVVASSGLFRAVLLLPLA